MKVKAAVAWEAAKPLEIEEIELEGPKRGEVLVRLAESLEAMGDPAALGAYQAAMEEGRPVAGALVYAFQADAEGMYTKVRALDEPNALEA